MLLRGTSVMVVLWDVYDGFTFFSDIIDILSFAMVLNEISPV